MRLRRGMMVPRASPIGVGARIYPARAAEWCWCSRGQKGQTTFSWSSRQSVIGNAVRVPALESGTRMRPLSSSAISAADLKPSAKTTGFARTVDPEDFAAAHVADVDSSLRIAHHAIGAADARGDFDSGPDGQIDAMHSAAGDVGQEQMILTIGQQTVRALERRQGLRVANGRHLSIRLDAIDLAIGDERA